MLPTGKRQTAVREKLERLRKNNPDHFNHALTVLSRTPSSGSTGYVPHVAAIRHVLQQSEFYDRGAARKRMQQKVHALTPSVLAQRALQPLQLVLDDLHRGTPEHHIAVERPHRQILAFLAKHEGGATVEQIQRNVGSGKSQIFTHLDRLARYGRVESNDRGSWWQLAKPSAD